MLSYRLKPILKKYTDGFRTILLLIKTIFDAVYHERTSKTSRFGSFQNSDYTSSIVLDLKKDGGLRFGLHLSVRIRILHINITLLSAPALRLLTAYEHTR